MALQDKIGREEIVDKICGLVGSLKKDKNFCLAINGAWGSGKSFVLGLIEEKLSKRQEYIIIKYDAWENTFYSDPLIAILCKAERKEGMTPFDVSLCRKQCSYFGKGIIFFGKIKKYRSLPNIGK